MDKSTKDHLVEISKYITNIDKRYDTFQNLKNTKIQVQNLDTIIDYFNLYINKVQQIKLKISKNIHNKTDEYKTMIEPIKSYFNITPIISDIPKFSYIKIGKPYVEIKIQHYKNIECIPDMSYGVVFYNDQLIVIYKYNRNNYVSCSDILIVDNIQYNNFRTISCNNANCCYKSECKYFHDPLYYKTSDHIQRFVKNNTVKTDPYFGSMYEIKEQLDNMKFEDVKSLARYCSIMNLLIGKIK